MYLLKLVLLTTLEDSFLYLSSTRVGRPLKCLLLLGWSDSPSSFSFLLYPVSSFLPVLTKWQYLQRLSRSTLSLSRQVTVNGLSSVTVETAHQKPHCLYVRPTFPRILIFTLSPLSYRLGERSSRLFLSSFCTVSPSGLIRRGFIFLNNSTSVNSYSSTSFRETGGR